MHIERYTPNKKAEWDAFVKESRNGTFLFLRDYMEYHAYDPVCNPAGRFHDHSLLYYNNKGKLLAVMPANETQGELWSHQGLTYGGLVLSYWTRTEDVCEMFDDTIAYLRALGFTAWYYKQIPTIYHQVPSQEDEYALWIHNAQMVKCGVSSTIVNGIPMSHDKRRSKPKKHVPLYDTSNTLPKFWPMLERNLMETYGARPVHTLEEMQLLESRFPDNIICCLEYDKSREPEAGIVLYIEQEVVHAQYMSASPRGKKTRAMERLLHEVIMFYMDYCHYTYFDLGTSTDIDGRSLQQGLIRYKESFGGRATVYKIYRIDIPQLLTPHS